MKKIVSYILLLAMCVAMFAGCAPKEDADLVAAKDYLYAMYKDASAKTTADFTVVSQVVVGENSYPITWTADVAEDLVKIVAGENNMTTIDINEAPEEDVNYTLTATLTNKDGETQSVSFKFNIPAVKKVETNGSAVIFYPADGQYVTSEVYTYTSSSGSTKDELVLSANKADAVTFTVADNGDGTVSLVANGKYLYCDATNVKFVDAQDDNTKFVLESTGDGSKVYIKCAVANYNGKPQYLEVYMGYLTCYGMQEDKADIYTFELQDPNGASAPVTPDASTPATPDASTPDASTPTTGATTPSTGATTPTTKPTTPSSSLPSKAVLALPAENTYVSGVHHQYNGKWELTMTSKKAEALALTLVKNSNGTVSFKSGKQFLFCDGKDVKFVTKQSDDTKFVLEATTGGYFIKCYKATYNNNPQYLEVFKGYLNCYGMNASNTGIYTFKLDGTSGAKGTISGQNGGSTSTTPTTPSTTPPSPTETIPPAVESGKTLTFDFTPVTTVSTYDLDANGAKGIFSGAALESVETTKVKLGNPGDSGAFCEGKGTGSGYLKLGNSNTNANITLKFSKKVAKVEITCHDWYTKSASYPTNQNQVSVNGGTAQLAPYTEDATMGTLTFNISASETVSIDTSKTSGNGGRIFISEIVITFA